MTEVIEPTGMGALYGALAKTQAIIGGAAKDRENPAFKAGGKASTYATLASIWEAWQAAGPQHGLSLLQLPGAFVDGKISVTTILGHTSGAEIRETLALPANPATAQGIGSAITYARRYALMGFCGIAPEDDDDGNAASQRGSSPDSATHESAPRVPAARAPAAQEAPPKSEADEAATALAWTEKFIVGARSKQSTAELSELQHSKKDALANLRAKHPEYAARCDAVVREQLEKLDPLDDQIPF